MDACPVKVSDTHLRCCLTSIDTPMQVIEGKDILWEGELPSSLSVLTHTELEQALKKQLAGEAGASDTGKHRFGHPVSVSKHFGQVLTGTPSWFLDMTHVCRAQGQHGSYANALDSCL